MEALSKTILVRIRDILYGSPLGIKRCPNPHNAMSVFVACEPRLLCIPGYMPKIMGTTGRGLIGSVVFLSINQAGFIIPDGSGFIVPLMEVTQPGFGTQNLVGFGLTLPFIPTFGFKTQVGGFSYTRIRPMIFSSIRWMNKYGRA